MSADQGNLLLHLLDAHGGDIAGSGHPGPRRLGRAVAT